MPKGDGRQGREFDDPEFRRRFDEALAKWQKITQPLIDAVRDSERITAADMKVRINCKGDLRV